MGLLSAPQPGPVFPVLFFGKSIGRASEAAGGLSPLSLPCRVGSPPPSTIARATNKSTEIALALHPKTANAEQVNHIKTNIGSLERRVPRIGTIAAGTGGGQVGYVAHVIEGALVFPPLPVEDVALYFGGKKGFPGIVEVVNILSERFSQVR